MKLPYKDAIDAIKGERGFALVLSLVVMAAMTAIGILSVMTSTTDMMIARNDREAKGAFFLAESGMQEAIDRMDLADAHARFVGETSAQKQARYGGAPTYTGNTFASDGANGLNLVGTGGRYDVTVAYATEGSDTWCDSDGCNGETVVYCADFGFTGLGVPNSCAKAVPVYKIDATGTTAPGGTEVKVRSYITASRLNLIPPAGDVFANEEVEQQGSSSVLGSVCAEAVTGCGAGCTNVCAAAGSYPGDADMMNYLGLNLADLKAFGDPPSPYTQTQNEVVYDTSQWGTACSTDPSLPAADHICGNDAKIIFIDTQGGEAKITGGSGRGLLIVTGELKITGNFLWEGMIYVMGELEIEGTATVYGTVMSNTEVEFNGNLTSKGSQELVSGIADNIGIPKLLRWAKR
ncbi:MAG: pilus assembly PilX N-terminal domain-containing protein [Deltaproteobacteria bacterium]|nr:pilus assembly PilX N-terminal domain-containing protein [Deltaproteobacteria bacterium]